MDNEEVTVTTEVVVPETEEETPPVDGEVEVVVIAPAPAVEEGTVTEAEVDRAVDTAVTLALLVTRVDDLAALVMEHDGKLAYATEIAEVALDEVEDMTPALEEEIAESLELDEDGDGKPDEVPTSARRHWIFRSFSEWAGGK